MRLKTLFYLSLTTILLGDSPIQRNKLEQKIVETINVLTPEQQLLKTVKEEYDSNKVLIDDWETLFRIDDSVRVIFDINTFEILDTVKDTRKARNEYFNGITKVEYDNRKSFKGKDSLMKNTFSKYDKYINLIRGPLLERNLPLILSYVPVIETNLTPAISNKNAIGYYQFIGETAGDLIVNKNVDERKSLVYSSIRAAEHLEANTNVFEDWRLVATAHVRGGPGVTRDLEDMLNLNKKGLVFDSYSKMVSFHVLNDFKFYEKDFFVYKIKINSPEKWNETLALFKESDNPERDAELKIYKNYLADYFGKRFLILDNYHGPKQDMLIKAVLSGTDKKIQSIFDYYDLENRDIYWQFHEYLKTTENYFNSPHYVSELIAVAHMHNFSFDYPKMEPISVKEIKPTRQAIRNLRKDAEFKELNRHITNYAIRNGRVPKETKLFLPEN